MKIVLVGHKGGALDQAQNRIKEVFPEEELTFLFRSGEEHIFREIQAAQPDLLITEDLEGFEMSTLTDAVTYNLLHCRQLHLLLRDPASLPAYADGRRPADLLSRQLSLVMFFYVRGAEVLQRLKEQAPDLPYADLLPEGDVPDLLPELVRQVLA